jgi:hypothetical protein
MGRALSTYTFGGLLFPTEESTFGSFFSRLCVIVDLLGRVVVAGKIQIHLNASFFVAFFVADSRPSSTPLKKPTNNRGQHCYYSGDYPIHDVIIIGVLLGLLVDDASMIAKISEPVFYSQIFDLQKQPKSMRIKYTRDLKTSRHTTQLVLT